MRYSCVLILRPGFELVHAYVNETLDLHMYGCDCMGACMYNSQKLLF